MVSSYLLTALALFLSWLYVYRRKSSKNHLPFPPGPKPLPVLGNLFDMPTSREHLTYTRWGEEYGDVVHVNALGQHLVILNSVDAANELLDQRSATFSSRPYIPMMHDPGLMDGGWTFIMKPYSADWRRHRRLFARHLNSTASRAFFGKQTMATHTLLRGLLQTPRELVENLRHAAADVTMAIAYGYDVKGRDDPYIVLADRTVKAMTQGMRPGGYMVNVLPWLAYVPAWFPGAGFKAFAAEARELGYDVLRLPFLELKERMDKGIAPPSFSKNALDDRSFDADASSEVFERDVQEVAASMYGAGADTTVSSMHSCVLALVLNPSVQARAQTELDAVLGPVTSPTFRLPTMEDRPNLPYIDCILKETLRWLTVVGMGVPHTSTEDDVYRGWRIPKGTIVIPNAWAMLHDPKTYPDPMAFRPERFLSGENKVPEPDPSISGAFGFGRRVCPGRFLAEASLWIQIASILAVFNFALAKDGEGKDIDVAYAAVPLPGLLLHPQPFPCSITPRSQEAVARIQETDLDVI